MTNSNKIIIGITAVAVLVVGFILGSIGGRNVTVPVTTPAPLGATVYDASRLVGDVYQGLNGTLVMRNGQFVSPDITGGTLLRSSFATTSTGAGTLTAASITGVNTILSTNAGALTLTLPASTTLSTFLPSAGNMRRLMIVNQGTALLTMAGGTGTLLQTASSTKAINIGGSALLTCVRKTNTDVICLMGAGI